MLGAGPKLHNSLLSLLSSARRKKQRSIHPLQGLDRWSTSVATRDSRSKLHSLLAAPSVPLYGEVQLTTREYSLLSSARRKKQRSIHPLQGLPLYGEDATDYEGRPSPSEFWYAPQSLCPSGRGMIIISKMTFDGHFYLNVLCEGGSSHLSS